MTNRELVQSARLGDNVYDLKHYRIQKLFHSPSNSSPKKANDKEAISRDREERNRKVISDLKRGK